MIVWPTVIVVRPRAQALAWAQQLRLVGVPAATLPLIAIRAAPDREAVAAAARSAFGQAQAGGEPVLVFVSRNAVEGFFAAASSAWHDAAWAAATGPGTAAALREAGVPESRIVAPPEDAPRFESEALWDVVAAWPWGGRAVWIVRGNGGREWLGDRLREAGARVDVVQAYERGAPELTREERQVLDAALAGPARWCWLFSSSEAIDRLDELAPGHAWGDSRALATHPRIAARALELGFGRVTAVRPDAAAVRDAIAAAFASS